jgi:hypothetical protein
MAMKILYLKAAGLCKVENWNGNERNLEMPDGPHPVTNDSWWQDSKRTGPPILMIIQGVLGPYGGSMAAEDVKTRMYEVKLASMAFKQPSVSKMWQRMLANAFAWFMKYGIILFIVAITGYAVINTLTGGAI